MRRWCVGGLGAVFLPFLLLLHGSVLTTTVQAGVNSGDNGTYSGLPADARVIETQELPATAHADRALVLWMEHPERLGRLSGSSQQPNEPYTCPDYTRGQAYRGPTRVSLVDLRSRRVLSTVKLIEPEGDGQDTFDIPYLIEPGYYYHVPGPRRAGEGRPKLLDLRDYNGDGQALEAAFFDAENCMSLPTTLIGYSVAKDRVVQYPILVNGKPALWLQSLFAEKPVRPGYWNYKVDFRGRGGLLEHYQITYDAACEVFRATVTRKP